MVGLVLSFKKFLVIFLQFVIIVLPLL